MRLGLFIGRMNPPHIWHIWVIKKALSENDSVLVLLWGNNTVDNSNPLSYGQRKFLLQKVFGDELIIWEILDRPTDEQWVWDIAQQVNFYNSTDLSIYWGDFVDDSAILALKKYQEKLNVGNIKYKLVDRFSKIIHLDGILYEISATNFRKALEEDHRELLEKLADEIVLNDIKEMLKK